MSKIVKKKVRAAISASLPPKLPLPQDPGPSGAAGPSEPAPTPSRKASVAAPGFVGSTVTSRPPEAEISTEMGVDTVYTPLPPQPLMAPGDFTIPRRVVGVEVHPNPLSAGRARSRDMGVRARDQSGAQAQVGAPLASSRGSIPQGITAPPSNVGASTKQSPVVAAWGDSVLSIEDDEDEGGSGATFVGFREEELEVLRWDHPSQDDPLFGSSEGSIDGSAADCPP